MKGVRAGDGAPRGPTLGPLQRNVCVCLCPGDPAPCGPPLRCLVGPPGANPGTPAASRLCLSTLRGPRTQWATTGPPDAHATRNQQGTRPAHARPTEWGSVRGGWPGQRVEKQGTWASRTPKHSEAGCGWPEDGGVGTAKTFKPPLQQPAQPLVRQLLSATDAQTAHPATFSTAPVHQRLGSANAETTPAGAPAAAANRKQRPYATCEGKNG